MGSSSQARAAIHSYGFGLQLPLERCGKALKTSFDPNSWGGGAGAGAGGSDQMKGRDVAPSVSFVISDTS